MILNFVLVIMNFASIISRNKICLFLRTFQSKTWPTFKRKSEISGMATFSVQREKCNLRYIVCAVNPNHHIIFNNVNLNVYKYFWTLIFSSPVAVCLSVRPYQCGHCSQSFSQPSDLRNHVVTHSSDRPFKCGYCGRAFAGATTLNNHIRTHTGEKPFK